MKQFIDKIGAKQNLTFSESKEAFKILMEGKANDQEIFDFLTLLSNKGESSDEIAGGVYVLREKSKRVNVEDCIDTCGTGCLLYTSPSPRDVEESRMPSSA